MGSKWVQNGSWEELGRSKMEKKQKSLKNEKRHLAPPPLLNEKGRNMEPQGSPKITENQETQVAKKLDISTSYLYRLFFRCLGFFLTFVH